MALYLGNRKIAALSQTINPEKLGDGLSVDTEGKLVIDPASLGDVLADSINGTGEDGEDTGESGSMDYFIDAVYNRIAQRLNTGALANDNLLGGNSMIDTESNRMFYQGLTRVDAFFDKPSLTSNTVVSEGFMGVVPGDLGISNHVLSVQFPKNMRFRVKTTAWQNVAFSLDNVVGDIRTGKFYSIPYPSTAHASATPQLSSYG